ncbi:MAG: GNAT family N-acetyltransferase [Actinobacteria bacterium]|nr:GNAT family N-acetyltransferase [Actinomycetota bacterium]
MEQATKQTIDYIDYRAIKKTKISEGKILIRPLTKKDLYQTINWLKDPQINKFLASNFNDLTYEKELEWLKEMKSSLIDFVFGIEDIKLKKYIGNCGIHKVDWENKICEFGIIIGDKNYWGKNFGTDTIKAIIKLAFKKLNLQKIRLFVYEYNDRAINAYKKCGFKIKDILIKDHLFENYYWNTLEMEIINENV